MEDILVKLSDYARIRVEESKKRVSLAKIRQKAEDLPVGDFPFEKALAKEGISFICEVKKASPSKGIISEEFPYLEIAKEYEIAGADAISVLTEPKWFLGDTAYLEAISKEVRVPLLRKDFTIDPYMIYEAKAIGASAILLICSIIDESELKEYLAIAKSLGLSVLTEAHNEAEIDMAIKCGANIIGVNNRNLRDFTVDPENAMRLRNLVPKETIFVSESGILGKADVQYAKSMQADAVLVGEAFMRAKNKVEFMKELRNA